MNESTSEPSNVIELPQRPKPSKAQVLLIAVPMFLILVAAIWLLPKFMKEGKLNGGSK